MNYALYGSISYNIDDLQTLKLMASNGVKEVFLWWAKDDIKSNVAKVKLCQSLGIKIQTAHLDFKDTNLIWQEGSLGDKFVKNYIKQFKLLKKYNIPIAVMHVTKSKTPPPMSLIGLKRFQTLVKNAEKYGIILALENTRKPEYFDYIFENINSDNLKVCYDSGHDHSFTKDTFDFEKYKNKIIAVHLHDNNSTSDQHLLPFDGNIDWKQLLTKLKKSGYSGAITLEVVMGDKIYNEVSANEFVLQAIERAKELIKIYESIKI